jgi:mRNA interferase HigB
LQSFLNQAKLVGMAMRIIARKTLRTFWQKPQNSDSEQPLRSWFRAVRRATWSTPADVKALFGTASVVGGNRIVFNIAGNKYRLVVRVNYPYRVVYIRFVGTHAEYDGIDATKV